MTIGFLCIITNDCKAAPKEIRIGTDISRTGPGAAFGVYQEWGFSTVVNEINKEGGIYLSKCKKVPVKLFCITIHYFFVVYRRKGRRYIGFNSQTRR